MTGWAAPAFSVPRTNGEAETVDVGDYLSRVRDFVTRYVVFPSEHEPVAVALWVAHAHIVDRFETSPILAVTSAEMRSGKTRVLDVLELLVPAPYRVVTPSEAVVYTVLAQRPRPTMLLDEADAIFGPRSAERYEGLRAILNAGNRQGTPVLRVKLEGKRREVDAFDVFGPKAIAGIGDLPSTVADVVDVPDELNDRAADSWEPLFAIADAAGGAWPSMARLAAVALGSDEDVPASVGMRLLAEIRVVFGEDDHLATAEMLRRLHDLEDAPWADWYGAPLTGRGLAKLLAPYRVIPLQRRVHGEKSRGYFRSDFTDAWARYVPVSDVPDVPLPQAGRDPSLLSQPSRSMKVDAKEGDEPSVSAPGTGTSGTSGTSGTASDAPTCPECGHLEVAVLGRPGRFVCTGIHRPPVAPVGLKLTAEWPDELQ